MSLLDFGRDNKNNAGEHLKFVGTEPGVILGRKEDVNYLSDSTEATIENTIELNPPQIETATQSATIEPEPETPVVNPGNVIPIGGRVVQAGLSQADASRDLVKQALAEVDADAIEEFYNASNAA